MPARWRAPRARAASSRAATSSWSATAGYSGITYVLLVPSSRTAPVVTTRSPSASSGESPPLLPTRRKVCAPSLISSSRITAVPGAPMPVEAAHSGTPVPLPRDHAVLAHAADLPRAPPAGGDARHALRVAAQEDVGGDRLLREAGDRLRLAHGRAEAGPRSRALQERLAEPIAARRRPQGLRPLKFGAPLPDGRRRPVCHGRG